mmetsp:Transcript_20841/g.37136  ORF Transcript_20841/g.37136 Transcript_20841/m.37136 type:complete len:361 (+) Transcript_20841:79-1161(+)
MAALALTAALATVAHGLKTPPLPAKGMLSTSSPVETVNLNGINLKPIYGKDGKFNWEYAADVLDNVGKKHVTSFYGFDAAKCNAGKNAWLRFVERTDKLVKSWEVKAKPLSEAKYAAVIVEARSHPQFEWVVKDVMKMLGPDWALMVYHGTLNAQFVRDSIGGEASGAHFQPIVSNGVEVPNLTRDTYGRFMSTHGFWDPIPANIENILVFQTDSAALRPMGPQELASWTQYSMIGAPWDWHVTLLQMQKAVGQPNPWAGNGGFSMRKVSSSKAAISCMQHAATILEDKEFVKCFLAMGQPVSNWMVAKDFSVESIFHDGMTPFGFHQMWCFLPDDKVANLLATSAIAHECNAADDSICV